MEERTRQMLQGAKEKGNWGKGEHCRRYSMFFIPLHVYTQCRLSDFGTLSWSSLLLPVVQKRHQAQAPSNPAEQPDQRLLIREKMRLNNQQGNGRKHHPPAQPPFHRRKVDMHFFHNKHHHRARGLPVAPLQKNKAGAWFATFVGANKVHLVINILLY